MDFLKKLNVGYSELLLDVLNQRKKPPKNVLEAYSMAKDLVVNVRMTSDVMHSTWTNTAASEIAMAANVRVGANKLVKTKENTKPRQEASSHEQQRPRNQSSERKPKDRSKLICYGCHKPGHIKKDCPERNRHEDSSAGDERVITLATFTCAETCMKAACKDGQPMGFCEVGADTMSSINLVSDTELLTDIRPAEKPVVLVGATGELVIDKIGDMGPFGLAWYHPKGIGNVISVGAAIESGWSRHVDTYHDEEVLSKDDWKFFFGRRPGRLVTCRILQDIF